MNIHPADLRSRYTLIEIVVALSVASILASFAVVYIGQTASSASVATMASDLEGRLTLCRRYAIDHGTSCGLVVSNVNIKMTSTVHAPWSQYGLYTFYGRGAIPSYTALVNGNRCWDLLPADPTGPPCDTNWWGRSDFDQGYFFTWWETDDAQIIGIGGEHNTGVTSIRTTNPAFPTTTYDVDHIGIDQGAIFFSPNGRVINPDEDFDCHDNINVWMGSLSAWRRDTKTYMEVSVSKSGQLSWRRGEAAHVDPYPIDHAESANSAPFMGLASANACTP